MDNYDLFFDVLDGKTLSQSDSSLPFDLKKLALKYYESLGNQITVADDSKFFGLINYCLEGRNIKDAIKYKTEKDYEFSKLLAKKDYELINTLDGNILMQLYNKYKNDRQGWELFKETI